MSDKCPNVTDRLAAELPGVYIPNCPNCSFTEDDLQAVRQVIYPEIERQLAQREEAMERMKEKTISLAHKLAQRDEKLKRLRGLWKVAVCPNCDGSGGVSRQVSERQYATRDMAIDGGDSSLEGSMVSDEEWVHDRC